MTANTPQSDSVLFAQQSADYFTQWPSKITTLPLIEPELLDAHKDKVMHSTGTSRVEFTLNPSEGKQTNSITDDITAPALLL